MNSKFQPCINIANRVKEISSYTGRPFVVVFDGKYIGLRDEIERKTIGVHLIAENGFERFVFWLGRFKQSLLIQSYRDNGIRVDYEVWARAIDFIKQIYGYHIAFKV